VKEAKRGEGRKKEEAKRERKKEGGEKEREESILHFFLLHQPYLYWSTNHS
jgi:hypothetical protein